MITLTANPSGGYQFDHWGFNYWPLDLSENLDSTANPLSFKNTYLKDDGYADSYDAVRTITAYFKSGSTAPQPPENLTATDGTYTNKVVVTWDSAAGAQYYEIYRADSMQGVKTQLAQISGTSYEDTTVIGEDPYYYWVKAVNQYGASAYSDPDSGYAYTDDEPPPPPVNEVEDLTPEEAKLMLDTDLNVIVVDVSSPTDYEKNHILCAINSPLIETVFDKDLNYEAIAAYKDYPVLVYDQDESNSREAAEYLAARGFSRVYHLTDGLAKWMGNGWETVDSEYTCECSLPPMAYAGEDQEAAENEPVSLDGSGSTAIDDGALTYAWRQFSGTQVDIENPDGAQAQFTSPYVQEGGEKLIFHLTVTDSQNNQDTDSVTVNVTWVNSPPVADAGEDQDDVVEDDTVTLDGSGSTDRDNGIVSWHWEQISGPEATIQNNHSETAWFIAPDLDSESAELVFQLTVTDKGGLSDSDQLTILVSRKNTPPTAEAGVDQNVSETQQVILNGSASYDVDEDDGIVSYSWVQIGDGPEVSLSSGSDPKPTFSAPEVEGGSIVLEFELTVTDKDGAQDTDQVVITVKDMGEPPDANAGANKNPVYEGWIVTLDGSKSADEDGDIQTYQWTQISGPTISIKNANTSSPSFTVPEIEGQTAQIIIELTVTDDTGLNGRDQVAITIQKAMEPPLAEAGADQRVKTGSTVFLDSSGSSDPDDGIVSYSWQQTGGEPSVDLSEESAEKPHFIAPQVEKKTTLTFELVVTDYSGNQDADEVQVTILPGEGILSMFNKILLNLLTSL